MRTIPPTRFEEPGLLFCGQTRGSSDEHSLEVITRQVLKTAIDGQMALDLRPKPGKDVLHDLRAFTLVAGDSRLESETTASGNSGPIRSRERLSSIDRKACFGASLIDCTYRPRRSRSAAFPMRHRERPTPV
jgi:hypothetical protein